MNTTNYKQLLLIGWLLGYSLAFIILIFLCNKLAPIAVPYDWSYWGCGDETNSLSLALSWFNNGIPAYGVNSSGVPFNLGLLTSPIYYLLYGTILSKVPLEETIYFGRLISLAILATTLWLLGIYLFTRAQRNEQSPLKRTLILICILFFLFIVFTTFEIRLSANFARIDALGSLACTIFGLLLGSFWAAPSQGKGVAVALFMTALLLTNIYAFCAGITAASLVIIMNKERIAFWNWVFIGIVSSSIAIILYCILGALYFGDLSDAYSVFSIVDPRYGFQLDLFLLYSEYLTRLLTQIDSRFIDSLGVPILTLALILLIRTLSFKSSNFPIKQLLFIILWIIICFLVIPKYRLSYNGMIVLFSVSFWFSSLTEMEFKNHFLRYCAALTALILLSTYNTIWDGRIFPYANPAYMNLTEASQVVRIEENNKAMAIQVADLNLLFDDYPDGSIISIEPAHALIQAFGGNILMFNPNATHATPNEDYYLNLLSGKQEKWVIVNKWFCRSSELCGLHDIALSNENAEIDVKLGNYRVRLHERINYESASGDQDYPYCGPGVFPLSVFHIQTVN